MNEQTKHTPGPWAAYGEHEFWAVETERQDNGKSEQIATCYSKANARLIAAAPDLLAALQGVMQMLNDLDAMREDGEDEIEAVAKCRAAIAKAEGK